MNTLVDLLDDCVRKFGPNPALMVKPTYKYLVWTYRDLWRVSGRVASWLQERGVGKGDRILIWAPNMPQWAMAWFGAFRAGAVPVPLDVRSAPDFVSRVSGLTEPKLALVYGRIDTAPIGDIPRVHLEEIDQLAADCSPDPAPVDLGPDDLAEIMFTSGTTGDPKGVMLTHRNIVSNAESVSQIFVGRESDSILSLLPLSHMLEQCGGMLVPLMSGARIVYPVSRQPTFLFKAFQENRISLLLLVPQGLQLLMNGIEREVRRQGKEAIWAKLHRIAPSLPMKARRRLFATVHKRFGGGLRCVFSGGSFLDPVLARKWENLGVPIVEGYGATEASPVITFNSMNKRVMGSVGRNLPGQKLRIADDGEVLAAGPNITPGYWRNKEATEGAFDGEWYKTGDLGYIDDSGCLYLRGRKKDLIVLANGQNVYPEDIERLLNAHPAVTEGVVVGLPAESAGAETVHAVLLLDETADAPQDTRTIIDDVNSGLADHQRITGHTAWPEEDFPRTHTLKGQKSPGAGPSEKLPVPGGGSSPRRAGRRAVSRGRPPGAVGGPGGPGPDGPGDAGALVERRPGSGLPGPGRTAVAHRAGNGRLHRRVPAWPVHYLWRIAAAGRGALRRRRPQRPIPPMAPDRLVRQRAGGAPLRSHVPLAVVEIRRGDNRAGQTARTGRPRHLPPSTTTPSSGTAYWC